MCIRKQGVIQSYNVQRRHGWITCIENGEQEKFFFYGDRIVRGPVTPVRDQVVCFDVRNTPVKPGQSRVAINLEFEPTKVPAAVVQALSGQEPSVTATDASNNSVTEGVL